MIFQKRFFVLDQGIFGVNLVNLVRPKTRRQNNFYIQSASSTKKLSLKMAEKDDGMLYDFTRQFADSLAVEFRFVEDIAHGLADSRPDAVQRHLSQLFTAVNFVASNAAPFGSGLISFITGQAEKHLQDKNNERVEKRSAQLSKHSPEKRTLLFEQIAREVMYRYGPSIYQFVDFCKGDQVALDRLSRTGAIRIIYFALKRNIGFEHCDKLVRGKKLVIFVLTRICLFLTTLVSLPFRACDSGMADGFEGFPERDMLTRLTEGVINLMDASSKKPIVFSCEGLYTRSGYMSPGCQYWIHSDYDRQQAALVGGPSVGGRRSPYVVFANAAQHRSGMHREDKLVPKYGYMSVPSASEPLSIGYRKHHPSGDESHGSHNHSHNHNHHVVTSTKFKYRYVSLDHIVHYLAAMKGVTAKVDFNTWLMQGRHAAEFRMAAGFSVQALYRGAIDLQQLICHNVNFADGVFTNVDFSYCVFRHIIIANLQQARLLGSTFIDCTATGSALSGANLSLSTIDGCKFEGLGGIITLNYGILQQTSFAGCTFAVSSFTGMEYDNTTLQSFSTSYARSVTGLEGSGQADERLYEMLLETKLKQEEMAALLREREAALRQQEEDRSANRDLLSSLRAADSQKEIKQSQRVLSVEEKIMQLGRRLDAFDRSTLGTSMEKIKAPLTTEDNPITKIFEVLFFLKPLKLLRLLQKNPDVVKWSKLPR
jgi:uncharacterized protein YjbI with pentapeptide repeats